MTHVIASNKYPITPAYLSTTMDTCFDSWFARHESTASIKIGLNNEGVTISHFVAIDYVKSFRNCGLLCCRDSQIIAVSPDGIEEIELPDTKEVVICSVEIKTRVKADPIEEVMKISHTYGPTVVCTYGDVTIKKCVHCENRIQVIHKSVDISTTYGVFIVSKVED